MKRRNYFGWLSVLAGVTASVIACTAAHFEAISSGNSYVVLQTLDKLGLVRHRVGAASEIRETSLLLLNDEKAMFLMLVLTYLLAALSFIFVITAERKCEPTQYMSIGFISAGFAIVRLNVLVGLTAMIIGFTGLIIVRRKVRLKR